MPTYLDEFTVGETTRFGSYEVTREEVLRFASAYDPQPFHLDDEAAAANPIFGRMSASGWHTAAMTMRMVVDYRKSSGSGALASPGVDELRWLRPVYPGDMLRAEAEVIEVRPSRSQAGIGSVRTRITVFNQYDDMVMSFIAIEIVARRES